MNRLSYRAGLPAGRLRLEQLEDRSVPTGDMVLHWNDVLLDAIRADRTAPPMAARHMAIVHAAVYDAVNAIDRTHKPYAIDRHGPRNASPEAAVAAAAHRTLVKLFPAQRAGFDAELADSLADIPNGPAENRGVALGRSVAQAMLARRRHDGADRTVDYTPGSDLGDWQPTPPAFLPAQLPQWPDVKPFTMTGGSQFRPPAPPALGSPEYAASFDEVRAIGERDSAVRTPEQTAIAQFWINGPGTATPPGHWNEAAQVVAAVRGNTLAENARLFALLNLAQADAAIVSWDCKFEFDFWRPVTAIRAADLDGNSATAADPDWTPLIVTPPFPAYTSGHSTFSAAGAAVLAGFFGTDAVPFILRSETPAAGDRSFNGFWQAAVESGLSRIYGGIHWDFDNVHGLATGAALGQFVYANYLRPIRAGRSVVATPPRADVVPPPLAETPTASRTTTAAANPARPADDTAAPVPRPADRPAVAAPPTGPALVVPFGIDGDPLSLDLGAD
jgi:membrane-associated phospholipid phosphatase